MAKPCLLLSEQTARYLRCLHGMAPNNQTCGSRRTLCSKRGGGCAGARQCVSAGPRGAASRRRGDRARARTRARPAPATAPSAARRPRRLLRRILWTRAWQARAQQHGDRQRCSSARRRIT